MSLIKARNYPKFTSYFKGLPFTTVQHKVTTMDAQPSVDGTSIIVLVTGQLIVRL